MKKYLSTEKRETSNEGKRKKILLLVTRYAFLFIVLFFIICNLSFPSWGQAIAPDPTRISIGSRILGMGKAFVGLSDDLGSIYINPSGLGGLNKWELTSMSGNLMEDFSYLNISGASPTNIGVVGLGLTYSSISGGYATRIKPGTEADPVYEVDPSQPMINYYNSVFLLSYGNKLQNLKLPFKLPLDMQFGANLKLFFSGMAGDGIKNGNANGMDMDLGVLSELTPWLRFGSTVQNILPAAYGGKLTYAGSGHYEYYPAIWKNGVALKIFGEEGSLRKLGANELNLLVDFDYSPTLTGYPVIYHAGIELKPVKLVSLRVGIDQDAAEDGTGKYFTSSNLTFGVGLNYGGFSFDYAYHQFEGAPRTTNNFFSLSYSPQIKLLAKGTNKVDIFEPSDKTVVQASGIRVKGKVNDSNIKLLEINNVKIDLGKAGSVDAEVPLVIGKNKISIEAYGDKGKIIKPIDTKVLRVLRLQDFPDVSADYWVAQPISLLAMQKVITGYSDGSFRPEGEITRAEMAALLMRSAGNDNRYSIIDNRTSSPESRISNLESRISFKDVSSRHWAAGFIADAAAAGIVKGYAGGLFKPSANISRAEGLAMIARFAGITEETYVDNTFSDISMNHWASKIISGSYRAGLLKYLDGKAFEPNRKLTRAETVEMLYKTPVIRAMVEKDLMQWETY